MKENSGVVTIGIFATLFITILLAPVMGNVSAPQYVSAKGVGPNQINLLWYIPNQTNGTMANYSIYRNGMLLTTIPAPIYTDVYKDTGQVYYQDRNVSAGSSHSYYIVARNSAGFTSPASATVVASALNGTASFLPSARIAPWVVGVTVGVPGGIPNRTRIVDVTAAPYNVDNTGVNDVSAKLSQAINEASPNDVIYLPEGLYRGYIYIGKSNITIRGAGANKTIFIGSPSINFAGDSWTWWVNPSIPITNGIYTGSTAITVSNASSYYVGQMVQVTTPGDTSQPVISPSGPAVYRKQNFMITAKSGNNLSIYPPMLGGFHANQSRLSSPVGSPTPYRLLAFSGVEDLTLSAKNGGVMNGINLGACYGCWVKNVSVLEVNNRGIYISDSLQVEVRQSMFTVEGSGSNHAAMLVVGTTGALIEDNTMAGIQSPFGLEVDQSTTGSVFGYNYMATANTNHGAHNSYNLYEGNYADIFISDGYYGSESETTIFRNKAGLVALKRFSRNFNVIGNAIRGYSLGQPNMGNGGSNGFAQPSQSLYWKDWSYDEGPRAKGVLIRINNSHGKVRFNSSADALRFYGYHTALCWTNPGCLAPKTIDWGLGKDYGKAKGIQSVQVDLATNEIAFEVASPNSPPLLPASGTIVGLWPRSEGFQELDLDVALTMIRKGNYISGVGRILADEELGNDTLPVSLYLSGKPLRFGNLEWPPYSPTGDIQNYTLLPAGFRLAYGKVVVASNGTLGNTSSGSANSSGSAPDGASSDLPENVSGDSPNDASSGSSENVSEGSPDNASSGSPAIASNDTSASTSSGSKSSTKSKRSGGGGSSQGSSISVPYVPVVPPIAAAEGAISDTALLSGHSQTFATNQVVTFYIKDLAHTLQVTEITPTSATITVASTPQRATLFVGDQSTFDVDDDSVDDLSVTLSSVSGANANLYIVSLDAPRTDTLDESISPQSSDPNTTYPTSDTSTKVGFDPIVVMVIGAALVAGAIIVAIGYRIVSKDNSGTSTKVSSQGQNMKAQSTDVLIPYLSAYLNSGRTREQFIAACLAKGWNKADIMRFMQKK